MSMETAIALVGLLVAVLTVILTGRRDTRGDAAERAETKAMLTSIKGGVDDLRVDNRTMREDLRKMAVDLARVDQSAKSAHHRIDDLQRHIHTDAPLHEERRETHG